MLSKPIKNQILNQNKTKVWEQLRNQLSIQISNQIISTIVATDPWRPVINKVKNDTTSKSIH